MVVCVGIVVLCVVSAGVLVCGVIVLVWCDVCCRCCLLCGVCATWVCGVVCDCGGERAECIRVWYVCYGVPGSV